MPYSELQVNYANFDQEARSIEESTNFRNSGEIITSILKIINCLLQLTPALNLPPFLTYLGSTRRSGVLADTITSNIISKLADDGLDITGAYPDGSPNIFINVLDTLVNEMIDGIVLNNKVCVEIPPGGVQVVGPTGAMTNALPVKACGMLI